MLDATININIENKMVVTEDRKEIYYDHYKNGHSKCVIIAHGFFNSKDSILLKSLGQSLLDEYDVVIMDFRGHGQSKGLFHWTAKEYVDLTAVLNHVEAQYENIGLIGFSLGAATSLITASKSDCVDSVIAVSGPTEVRKIEYHLWKLDVENDIFFGLFGRGRAGKGVRPGPFWLKKDKPINVVEKIKAPVLYIHGESDWLIKPWHAKALYDKTRSPKDIAIIKQGPHAEYLMRKHKDEMLQLIKDWFKETLNKGDQ